MKSISGLATLSLLAIGFTTTAAAAYTETMDPNGPTKNAGTDYGLVDDNARTNQSDVMQKAIDAVAAAGGGRLVIPKGTYRFANVLLKSNVHLLIKKDTVIKPFWPEGTKAVVFNLDAERPITVGNFVDIERRPFMAHDHVGGTGAQR